MPKQTADDPEKMKRIAREVIDHCQATLDDTTDDTSTRGIFHILKWNEAQQGYATESIFDMDAETVLSFYLHELQTKAPEMLLQAFQDMHSGKAETSQ